MAWYDELNQGTFQTRPRPGSIDELRAELAAQQGQQQQQKPKDKGNFLTSLIPTGGGIAGAAGGAALGTALLPGAGTLVGALLGGAFGGGAGKVAENAVIGEEDLGKGVAQEALLSGVLGAGPIRLAKAGIDTARGVKAGANLTDAVTQAGTKAVDSSARRAVGEKLTNASNDLVIKNFRLTPSQLNNYKAKFGEDASQTIKNYKLVGKDADTIAESAIKPLQSEFDTIAKQIPTLPTADVLRSFKSKYQPLISSAVEDNRIIGQQLKQQADTLAKKYGSEIPSTELTALRQEFDSLVNYTSKAADPARYGVNKRSADAIRSSLQQAADKAGLKASNGMSFKEVGTELSKLRTLNDNIASQEQLGRGSNPLGLSTLLGGGVGSVGGLPGAIGGMAVASAVNSTAAKRAVAKGAEAVGTRLSSGISNPYGVGAIAGRVAPVGLAGAYLSSEGPNNSQSVDTTATSANVPSSSSIGSLYNTDAGMSTSQSQNPYPQENLMYDLQRDPANADKYIAYFKALQEAFPSSSNSELSQTTRSSLASSDNAINTVDQLQSLFTNAGGGSGRIGGTLKGLAADAGFDEAAKVYNSLSQASVTQIAKALAGPGSGTVSDMDAKVIIAALPTLRDNPDEARAKFAALRQRLETAKQNSFSYGAGGSDSLADALMRTQGGF